MKKFMRNVAPKLVRQRVIIELLTTEEAVPAKLKEYLLGLIDVTKMQLIHGPDVHSAHEMGFEARVHWKTSGTSVYTYSPEANGTPFTLVTVDCYTCKAFDVANVVEYTRAFFNAVDVDYMEPTH